MSRPAFITLLVLTLTLSMSLFFTLKDHEDSEYQRWQDSRAHHARLRDYNAEYSSDHIMMEGHAPLSSYYRPQDANEPYDYSDDEL